MRPALRLEGDYGLLAQKSKYTGFYTNDEQVIYLSQYHRSFAGAYGLRGTAGLAIDFPMLTLFPRLEVAYVPSGRDSFSFSGAAGNYPVQVENRYWAVNVGAEAQFARRIILMSAAIGAGAGYSSYRLTSFESAYHDTKTRTGFLVQLGMGLRAPLRSPVTFGTRALVESTFGYSNAFELFITQPSYRLLFSVFIEFDPLYAQGGK